MNPFIDNSTGSASTSLAGDVEASAFLSRPHKWRLVVLEASWSYGKGMYRQLCLYREKNQLPPLRCVKLSDVVGEYWRFHEEGLSAVSSIEAIAHTVAAAELTSHPRKEIGGEIDVVNSHASISQPDRIENPNTCATSWQSLLFLFRLQKHRVLKRVKEGGRPPKAIQVSGSGIGSWSTVTGEVIESTPL